MQNCWRSPKKVNTIQGNLCQIHSLLLAQQAHLTLLPNIPHVPQTFTPSSRATNSNTARGQRDHVNEPRESVNRMR